LEEQILQSEMQRKAMTCLMGLQFKITYRRGKENFATNALSRVGHTFTANALSEWRPQWLQEVLNSYATDPAAQLKLQKLTLSSPDEQGYELKDGLIHLVGHIWIGENSALQTKLINAFHSSTLGGHSGILATYQRLKPHFVWSGMKQQVQTFMQQCAISQHAKHSHTNPAGLLRPLPIPKGAWRDMDFIGPSVV
jgi:hypothetical protein